MTIYTDDEEERMRAERMVREWTRSDLLTSSQAEAIGATLQVSLRRTNMFLRAVLAFFTGLLVAASVGLALFGLDLTDDIAMALLLGIAGSACALAATTIASRMRAYRFGVEEAFAMAAVVLVGVSGAFFVGTIEPGRNVPDIAGVLLAAGGCAAVFSRFGYVYAACGAVICGAMIPFALSTSDAWQRGTGALVFVCACAWTSRWRAQESGRYLEDDVAIVRAVSFAGAYACLNLQWLSSGRTADVFYWATYAAIWLLPAVATTVAVRQRDRMLLDVSLAAWLATILTNKAYLGWQANSWDPIVLGVVLIGCALLVRRWLAAGVDGARAGFTGLRILEDDRVRLAALATLSAARPLHEPLPSAPPSPFAGGRSGGAGGGTDY